MKIYITVDSSGKVLRTIQAISGFDIRVIPIAGQTVLELDVSMDFESSH